MNEKQLQGMLHYHPISSTGGDEELQVSLHLAVCRITCAKEQSGEKVGGDTGLQTFDWDCEASSPTHQTLHFLICLGQASFLSAINLQLHPPIFIPFPIFITGSPSPLVQLALGRFTLGLITVHRCTHASNNGLLGPLSATFYRARRASC